MPSFPHFALLFCASIYAETSLSSTSSVNTLLSATDALSSIANLGGDLVPTGTGVSYITYSTTRSVNGTADILATTFAQSNGSRLSTSASSSTSPSMTLLQGSNRGAPSTPSPNASVNGTMAGNSTASRTSSSVVPTNTQPCNNYPEFRNRRYSNITMVAAHNSPFINPSNAAANQELSVLDQLNDGIQMLQGQTHYNTTTKVISYCHTSCDLLNAGTALSFFTNISHWVRNHPYDVVTLLIGSSDFIGVGNYTAPLEASGLSRYAYVPTQVPINISSWPTLANMILTGTRVVIFMDYNANQTEVPYILDEFSQLWETPFSPTNRSFPCVQQRPPGLSHQDADNRMYMANHNLNTNIALAGTSLLVPTLPLINETNALTGYGSLGLMANNCVGEISKTFPHAMKVDRG